MGECKWLRMPEVVGVHCSIRISIVVYGDYKNIILLL